MFFTSEVKKTFTKLRQTFIGAPILNHFDPKRYIQIETDAFYYTISRIFSQLTLDDLGRWHLVAFFSRKMIPAETWYGTHDGKLLAIVKVFKTWKYYLEGCKHEVLVLTDYNNLQRFMDMKSLSFRQVCWAQKLSRYHFRIDYQQSKANGAADALFWYLQWSAKENETLWAENIKILYWFQSSLAKVLGMGILGMSVPFPLDQVFICKIAVLPQLCQFWDTVWSELADKDSYIVSIGGMRIRLPELQDDDKEAKKLRSEGLSEGWKIIEQILHYQGLPYVPKVICSELISRYYDNPLVGHFGIEKIWELIVRKYYWPTLRRDIEAYVKGYNVCLVSKTVCYKPYGDL